MFPDGTVAKVFTVGVPNMIPYRCSKACMACIANFSYSNYFVQGIWNNDPVTGPNI